MTLGELAGLLNTAGCELQVIEGGGSFLANVQAGPGRKVDKVLVHSRRRDASVVGEGPTLLQGIEQALDMADRCGWLP